MEPAESPISRNVRVALAERNISAAELARRLGVAQSFVARRMRGAVAWRAVDLVDIARELDMDVVELIAERSTDSASVAQ